MKGSNHLVEMDAEPQHLCPVCLHKLHFCANFDAVKRYEQLRAFYRRHEWFEESDWVGRQLAKVPKPAEAMAKKIQLYALL